MNIFHSHFSDPSDMINDIVSALVRYIHSKELDSYLKHNIKSQSILRALPQLTLELTLLVEQKILKHSYKF